MITLTTAHQINSVLGGSAPIAYNKLVISPFQLDPVNSAVNGTLRLTSTSNPDMQAITGSLTINTASGVLVIQVEQLDFYRRIVLTTGQRTTVNNIIANAQNALEAGLVSLGVVAGTQAAGV